MVIIRDISVVRVPGVGVPGDDLAVLLLGVVAGVVVGLFWLCGRIADRIGDWRDKRNPERVVRRDREIMERRAAYDELMRRGEEKWGPNYDEDGISLWPEGWRRMLEREIKAERRAARKAERS